MSGDVGTEGKGKESLLKEKEKTSLQMRQSNKGRESLMSGLRKREKADRRRDGDMMEMARSEEG